MVTNPLRMIVMAGGTGGHVFPALAVADVLREKGVGVSWLGTRHGIESRLVPAAGYEIDYIDVQGLRGNGLMGWLMAPVKLIHALWQANTVMRTRKPAAVLGLGGFVTGPGGIACRLAGIPLLLHEQNAIPGLTNKLLSHIASVVMEAFPGSFSKTRGVIHTGNPVRNSIVMLDSPDRRLGKRDGRLRLLVLGGSLGAQALNEIIPAAVARFTESERPEVRHQSGKNKLENTQAAYHKHNVVAEVYEFISDMAAAYAWADLVICRAGALTIAELTAAGIGAVLVPYPHAVDDHQTMNAHFMVNAGAAILLPQMQLTVETLYQSLIELFQTRRTTLLKMANAAHSLAKPDATQHVAELCLRAANG